MAGIYLHIPFCKQKCKYCSFISFPCVDKIDNYISAYSKEAKSSLSQDTKTFLSNLNVSDNTLPQLLHTGAHDYSASRLYEQTIGVSILLGAILSISHGKK